MHENSPMNILTHEQWILKARKQFDQMLQSIEQHSQDHLRIDKVERGLFADLLALGLTLLQLFVAKAGKGDEGRQIEHQGRSLRRSEEPKPRRYHSPFGILSVVRWVYSRGPKKKIERAPTDERLGLPKGEYSYVLQDWLERFCVNQPFAEGTEALYVILGIKPSVETAEEINARMAVYAESFRMSQPPPLIEALESTVAESTVAESSQAGRSAAPMPEVEAAMESDKREPDKEAPLLVATADGTSVPMCVADRSGQAHPQADQKHAGATRRAYVGAVYSIDRFVRQPQEVFDELFRDEAAARRPAPQGKRLWAEMAAAEDGPGKGCERVFVELAVDVHTRDPERRQTLICLMDGERKLWDLQECWLGRSVEILDFFHVLKRVREVSQVVFSGDTSRRESWVGVQVRDLLEGGVERVVNRWRRLPSGQGKGWSSSGLKTVTSAIGYFRNNRHRMRYDEYLGHGYPIGSGMAEGACRNLVKDRMDGTGMHWRFLGARAMLKTRALYLNGEWDAFVEYRIQQEQETLYQTAA